MMDAPTSYVLGYSCHKCGLRHEAVQSFASLRQRVDAVREMHSDHIVLPFGFDLMKDNGRIGDDPSTCERLTFAFDGFGRAVLFYLPGDAFELPPPDRKIAAFAVGDELAIGAIDVNFGGPTEIPARYLISDTIAWDVIKEWFERLTLSNKASWTTEFH